MGFMTFLFRCRIKISTNLDSNTLEARYISTIDQFKRSLNSHFQIYQYNFYFFHFEELIEALHSCVNMRSFEAIEIRFDISSSRYTKTKYKYKP